VCVIQTLSIILLAGTTRPSELLPSHVCLPVLNKPRRNFDYAAVHIAGAERIASITAKSGVPRLVHVSHLNASHNSTSKFYQTKAEGEERVKAAFPNATIVRPASMYGYEDKLLNNIASMLCDRPFFSLAHHSPVWPIWWKLNHGETKIRPVHVSFVLFNAKFLIYNSYRSWMLHKHLSTSCHFLHCLKLCRCPVHRLSLSNTF
jgi:hypothetical protein